MSTRSAGSALTLHDDTHREVLSNGLTLLMRRDRGAPVAAIVTHVKAGYFDESDDIVGIAHVLEHMFFKGTPTRGVGAIARETKSNGGYLNAHTIYDHTSYYTVLPSASFVQGLDIQFDAYAHSQIDGAELARELEVIIQEVMRKRDSPTAVTIESLYALLHDHHRIRRWRIGDEAELRMLTQAAVTRFYRTWYQPSNTILSVVGDVDPDVVRAEVMARYGQLSDTPVVRDQGPVETRAAGFRVREWAGDIAQQQLAFGWRAPGVAHPDAPALELAGVALGTGRASRLYRAVRERQLASSVSAWHYTTSDIGVFVVHAEAPAQHAAAATLQMWREVQAARNSGFRVSEIVRAQRVLEARWLRRLETMDGQATYLASWEADGGLARAERYYDRLLSSTARDVHEAVERHLHPDDVSVISYRPLEAQSLAASFSASLNPRIESTTETQEPIADTGDTRALLRDMLRTVEEGGSSVLPPPHVPTPAVTAVVDAHTVASPTDRHVATVLDGVSVFELTSGVTVLISPRAGAPIASVGIVQRGGSMSEPVDREGLARLTAHAMLKGTTTRTGARIAEATEELGASIGVSAGLESLGWSLSVPVRHLPTAVELLADVTQNAVFPDDAVDTERSLALAEVTRLRDDMYRWPMRLASMAAYGAHPYGRTVTGTPDSLAAIDTAQVRAFHAAHILRAATVIAVVGDVVPEETAALIDTHFAALRFQADAPVPAAIWPTVATRRDDARDKQQSAITLMFSGPARNDPARYAARVLSAIASGLGGRFFEQLRDRQSLAYTVSAFPVERRAGGAFVAYIATSPAREAEAREGLLREFDKLRAAAPTAEELERAQHYLIGTHAIAQQSGGNVLGELVDAWLFGSGLAERRELATRIAAVTPDDIRALAERYFDPSRVAEGIVRGTSGTGSEA